MTSLLPCVVLGMDWLLWARRREPHQGCLWSGNLRVSRVARMSVPRRQGGNREAFLHLVSEAMLHPFHHILPLFLAVLGLHCCSWAFSSYGYQAPEHGVMGGGAQAELPRGVWNLPRPGMESILCTGPSGKPFHCILLVLQSHRPIQVQGVRTQTLISGRNVRSFVAMFPNHRHRHKKITKHVHPS